MRKILIVSSDRQLLSVLKHELSYRDYTVLTTDDPYLTFINIQLFEPDLLIVDFILNDHNGGAISHQVKSDPQTHDLPVIILSDYELETRYPSRFGCDIVIEKTDNIQPLIARINHLFEERELTLH
jgi:two-component system alkaline phosphatase synthesis response regulator PhoP/two-component system response regulator VicR